MVSRARVVWPLGGLSYTWNIKYTDMYKGGWASPYVAPCGFYNNDLLPESVLYFYSLLIIGGIVELSSYLLPIYLSSRVLDNKLPPSNCAKVIILPVCSFEDVAKVIYDTAGHIAIYYA